VSALRPYMAVLGLPRRQAKLVRWLASKPLTHGEWLALVRRQSKELSIRETAFELDVTPSRVHHLCAAGVLKKTRKGFIDTRAVYNYVAKEQADMQQAQEKKSA